MNTSPDKPSSFPAQTSLLQRSRLRIVVRVLLVCLLVIGLAPFSLTATQQAYAATTHTVTYDADGGSGISLPEQTTQHTGDMIAIYDGTGLARTGDTFTFWKATWSDGVEQEVTLGEVIALRDADLTLTAQYAGAALSKNSTTEGTLPVIARGWCVTSVGGVGSANVATITFTDTAPVTYAKKWDVPSSTVDAYAVDNGSGLYDVYLVSPEVIQEPWTVIACFLIFPRRSQSTSTTILIRLT